MSQKKVLILLGGSWHDFTGFTLSIKQLLPDWDVEGTYDLDRLFGLKEEQPDLVISDTCLSRYNDGREETGPFLLSDAQITALTDWVREGGAFLAYHSATALGNSNPALGVLIGGVFVEHPPQFAFTVYPIYGEHPITDGIEAFTVHDEFYMERLVAPVNIHLLGFDRGTAYPLVWSKLEGEGRVAHVALGHSALTWDHPMYQKLMLNVIGWLRQDP